MEGIVINYNGEKGYGFIKSNTILKPIFFRLGNNDPVNPIVEGDHVIFDIMADLRGDQAIEVKKVIIAAKK